MTYTLQPITRKAAREWITEVHRHLSAPVGDVIRVALTLDGVIVGVGMAGRPVARMLDDGRTLEITRIAVLPGHDCACSRLYGALRRAGAALGWSRFVTYTLASEPGTSLRASGWREGGPAGGASGAGHPEAARLLRPPRPRPAGSTPDTTRHTPSRCRGVTPTPG